MPRISSIDAAFCIFSMKLSEDVYKRQVINEENKTAVVKFQNKLVKEELFSHTDVIENRFRIGDDGKVSITQDKLLDNTSDFNLYRISQNVLKAVEKEEQ